MIRFCGTIKREHSDKIIKLRNKQCVIMVLSWSFVFGMIGIVLAICFHSKADLYGFLICGAIILLLAIFALLPFGTQRNSFEWKYDIIIDDGIIKVIYNHQNGVTTETSVKKIKKVVDYGEYYLLFLYRWEASHSIICQKDLLIEGSIEKFEKLFEDKIKRTCSK